MQKNIKKSIILLVTFLLVLLCGFKSNEANAAVKQYAIVITGEKGSYTFYDLNSIDKTPGIELTATGKIMVPLKKLCEQMPSLKFQYDTKSMKATITNSYNGKKIIVTKNSDILYYYSNSKAKALKKTMPYKLYASSNSSALMIHMSALKWVMGATTGVKSYKTLDMQTAGYDTSVYSGLIVYNPYGEVNAVPKATSVTNISKTVKVTIPEGYSVAQVFDLLVKKGVCASTDLLYQTMETYDYTYYPLVAEMPANDNRCFILEGYLYPDTYEFYRLDKPENVLGKFLRNAEAKISDADREKAASLGYSVNDILTIASLIEKETGNPEYMVNVSSVIYNRLGINMPLQLDCGTFYIERYVKPYITGDVNRYNSYYNMYKCKALPAGPICNPGKNAIQAALNPVETDYLFFYSDSEGVYHFSAN
jgi:UPF0755 protein